MVAARAQGVAAILCSSLQPYAFLQAFVRSVRNLWFQQLRRRSQRGNSLRIWEQLAEWTQRFFPPIRILHPWPDQRFHAVHTRGRSRVR